MEETESLSPSLTSECQGSQDGYDQDGYGQRSTTSTSTPESYNQSGNSAPPSGPRTERDEIFEAAKMLSDASNFEIAQHLLLKYRLRLQMPKEGDIRNEKVLLSLWLV